MREKNQAITGLAQPALTDGWRWEFGILCLILAVTAIVSPAQDKEPFIPTLTTLYSFEGTDAVGSPPVAGLVEGFDGNLYGTTYFGAPFGSGAFFKMASTGTPTALYVFRGFADGKSPDGLVLGTDGNFYGTTIVGGAYDSALCGIAGCGTFFRMTSGGVLDTLYNFCAQSNCSDGANPTGELVQGTDGNFYGTTALNEGSTSTNEGTVFKITPKGTLTTLWSFTGADGASPSVIVQTTNGDVYGITIAGGSNDSSQCGYSFFAGCGTVFKITPRGVLATLYSFCAQSNCTDGYSPSALLQGNDGNFYGLTSGGGASGSGTLFKITSAGVLTTLYSFCAQPNCADGSYPQALIAASNSGFYGVTGGGGAHGDGTIFTSTPTGGLTTLHSFDGTDGSDPTILSQATSGLFYGSTYQGGAYDDGTLFRLSVGISAYVETLPTSGKVGASVKILGTDLTGATSVSFNGTAAVFTVTSRSLITTTVPEGATTGFVTVTTPTGTPKSNVKFQVRP